MHAKPDLRVESEPDDHFFRLGDLCRYLAQKIHMNANDEFNTEYGTCYEKYRDLAEHLPPYDFYVQVTSEGVSHYYASCMLRDCFGMNLLQCKEIMDRCKSRNI